MSDEEARLKAKKQKNKKKTNGESSRRHMKLHPCTGWDLAMLVTGEQASLWHLPLVAARRLMALVPYS